MPWYFWAQLALNVLFISWLIRTTSAALDVEDVVKAIKAKLDDLERRP